MKRIGWWSTVVGSAAAGLLVAAPAAWATGDSAKSATSGGGLSGHDTASTGGQGDSSSSTASGGGLSGHDTASGQAGASSGSSSTESGTATGSSGGASDTGSASGSGAASSGSAASDGGTASGSGSEARGSGQGGVSTGARPGEVTGAEGMARGTSEREAAKAADATHQVWGKVEKFDRDTRTLSLEDSEKKLKMTDDTQVLKDGNRVSPGQIMEGDEIRASYGGSGDAEALEVSVIEVVPAMPETGTGSGSTSEPSAAPPATGGSDDKASGSSSESSGSTGTKSPQ